ncbi:unnamed protein product [Medioppia subpectinata]|uniref:Carboxylesterase type B domain-containing protein n=1 Tax=Medioppia subpectinata TaxID=1979941 RepID=A0A7R9L8T2_9ACAR|nr:unnamed protein product [Medioppia subpectinata]CAG2116510.1 unnamed protein product [Medioppia subpectinata]
MYYTVPTLGTEYLPVSAHQAFQTKEFNKDLELLAGAAQHEGPLVFAIDYGYTPSNLTEKSFHAIAQAFDIKFHNLNVDNIITFYMSSINKSDADQVRRQLYDLYGDLLMTCPTHYRPKVMTPKSGPDIMGVTHGSELDFVFGLPLIDSQKTDTEVDKQFSRDVMKMWTDFAKYDKPTVDWPKLIDYKAKNYVPKAKELN